jgi:aryl-alcohol dehydrogenase-like predicted oxidoreductase
MEYVKLGNTVLDVSPICLGAMSFGTAENWVHNPWALNEEDSRAIIKGTLDLGINFFDTANVYAYGQSEKILGRAIKNFANRNEVVVAMKVFGKMRGGANGGGLSRKYILSQIVASGNSAVLQAVK